MALGFVVARFGLFLALISTSTATPDHHSHWLSGVVGIALILLGVAIILLAVQNHRLYVLLLPPEDIPPLRHPWLTTFLAVSVAAIGVLLAAYLAVA